MGIFRTFSSVILAASSCYAPLAIAAETAQVLPKGIFRARVVGIQTAEVNQTLNNDGKLEGLTSSLNRSVTMKDFAAQKPELAQLAGAMNALRPGSGDQMLNSNLYSDFSTQVQSVMPAVEYGLTQNFSLGIRLPITKTQVTANFDARSTNNAAVYNQQLGELATPELSGGLAQLAALQMNAEFFKASLFTSKGYEAPKDFTTSEIGDLEFGGKYRFFKNEIFTTTAQLGVRAPTGRTASLTNIFDKGTGNGSWAAAFQMFQEAELSRYLTLGAMEKVLHNFTDVRQRAVPRDAQDSLPSVRPQDGQVEDVRRDQGLQFESEVSATVSIMERTYSAWGAYQYLNKGKDRYSGSRNLYYDGLAVNSEQERHAGEFGLGFSTISMFRKKQFAVPMEVQALYNTTLAGRNAADVTYGRMDLIVYF